MSIFSSNKVRKLKTSRFDLSHTNLLTTKFGELIPFMFMDCVPGDKVRLKSEMLVKFAPMIAPIMSEIDIMTWYFKVPYRLVWDNFEDFITGGRLGTSEPTFPTFEFTRAQQKGTYKAFLGTSSLCDYFGVPNFQGADTAENQQQTIKFSQLPFRAYQLIYNDYFRDQNLENELVIPKSNGNITLNSDFGTMNRMLTIRQKKFKKDYFTSALPWAQRYGNEEVTVPLTGRMEVMLDDEGGTQRQKLVNGDGVAIPNSGLITDGSGETQSNLDPNGTLYTDFDQQGVGLNIQDLRYSNALQRWLENNARFGSRYIEQILARFGIRSSDARLQRPELVGGGIQNVMISEIMQQSQSTDTSPQGNRSGDANSFGIHRSYKDVFCEEHCMIIGIMSIVPKSLYFQGLPKHLTKFDRFEFFNPEFQTLGEQPIKNSEIWFSGNPEADNATFGYTPRYAEYKFKLGEIHGDFKESLDFFHMARMFNNRPALNNTFISVGDDDYERIWAVQKDAEGNETEFSRCWVQIYNNVKAKRPMMYNPNPSL